ncbi:MAG TPA: hypothetical protein PKA64_20990, partial [Myxococcota bacterium]|nr:hypothetical protein [Myxococcota bacterium]
MGARFEVDVEGGRLVRWASGGVAWSLRGHRVDGQPRVALTRAGEALGVVAVGELWDLVDAVGVLFDGAVTGSTERARDPDRRPAGPPSAGEPWTDELDQDLTARWEAGERIKELARRFGRTQG